VFDILIRNGKVVDGTGNPWQFGDVGIEKGKIAAIGKLSSSTEAKRVLDASGLVVAPGFIDVHTHSDVILLKEPRHESRIRQGVTTDIVSLCGLSYAPSSAKTLALMREYLEPVMGDYDFGKRRRLSVAALLKLYDRKTSVNVGYLAPHAAFRVEVRGMRDGVATPDEIKAMKPLVEQAMADGAIGFSTGLTYFPTEKVETTEIIELCKPVAAHGGVFVTHMRNYVDGFNAAVRETCEIGEKAGLPVQISHMRLLGETRHRAAETLESIEAYRARGVDIAFDCYPYLMGCTFLNAFVLAASVCEGGAKAMLQRIRDPKERIMLRRGGQEPNWDDVFLSAIPSEKNRRFEGLSLAEFARQWGKDPLTSCCELILEEGNKVTAIGVTAEEEDLRKIISHRLCVVGSDAIYLGGRCHPRVFGSFSRYLAVYCRDLKLMTLEEAVRKITSLPARRFGFTARGVLRKGMAADVTVFDFDNLKDKATYQNPRQFPEGVKWVIVNGQMVLDDGQHTGATPGRALRGSGSA